MNSDEIRNHWFVGTILSEDPFILLAGLPGGEIRPLGILQTQAAYTWPRNAAIFLSPMWTLQDTTYRSQVEKALSQYRQSFPDHLVVMLLNDSIDYLIFDKSCVSSTFILNKNCFCDLSIFNSFLNDDSQQFSAIYNARFSDYKQHELAADVNDLALICSHLTENSHNDLVAILPKARVLNLQEGALIQLDDHEVALALSASKCGLILSPLEGQNWATIEYLLIGLPVISTPNYGGRDRNLTPANSLIVNPEVTEVSKAVDRILAGWTSSRSEIAAHARLCVKIELDNFRSIVHDELHTIGLRINLDSVSIPHKAPSIGRPFDSFILKDPINT